MPYGAQCLYTSIQNGGLYVWAEVHTDRLPAPRDFYIVPTGWDVPEGAGVKYIGTAMTAAGDFVVHVYEDQDTQDGRSARD